MYGTERISYTTVSQEDALLQLHVLGITAVCTLVQEGIHSSVEILFPGHFLGTSHGET